MKIEHRTLWVMGVAAMAVVVVLPLMAVDEWQVAQEDYVWSFPEDHWAREAYKTEWWYFTGHLEAETGERFGYQFTFFRVGLLRQTPDLASSWVAKDLVMGHTAVTTLGSGGPLRLRSGQAGGRGEKGGHRFSEVLYRASPLLGGFGAFPDSTIAWCRGPAGTDGDWRLTWNGSAFDFEMVDEKLGFAFRLKTLPEKSLTFQGPNGFSRKGEGPTAASQYYSFTRLITNGEVTLDEETFVVAGMSWMDKEFGSNQLGEDQVGWDWFSLQLADGRDLMLYVLRDAQGDVDYSSGSLVEASGDTRYLTEDDFELSETDTWVSPDGVTMYPARWRLSIPSADLVCEIRPELADQENRSEIIPTMRYWEGAVRVVDTASGGLGQGYVELTGYGDSSRPAI